MTDNEIIKALECAIRNDCACNCVFLLPNKVQDVLDLINRLQAEVEELRAEVNHYANESDAILADIDFRDAENERLRAEIKRLKKDSNSLIFNLIPARGRGKTSVLKIKIEEIKAEAYKEFAEKYKNQIKNYTGMFTDEGFMVSFEAVLSAVNFIKDKLVGEDNEQTT